MVAKVLCCFDCKVGAPKCTSHVTCASCAYRCGTPRFGILHVLSDIDDIRIFDDEKLLSLKDWRLPIQSLGFLCALP